MKKISFENLIEKEQHLNIMDMFFKYPDGLTLHELTYLLTNRRNMQNLSSLIKNFGTERRNIFTTNQRILDCLTDLEWMIIKNKIKKRKKIITRYKLDSNLLFLWLNYVRVQKHNEMILSDMSILLNLLQYYSKIKKTSILPGFVTDEDKELMKCLVTSPRKINYNNPPWRTLRKDVKYKFSPYKKLKIKIPK